MLKIATLNVVVQHSPPTRNSQDPKYYSISLLYPQQNNNNNPTSTLLSLSTKPYPNPSSPNSPPILQSYFTD
ncbi:hypothetical protein P8452_49283 [Trifolium repens]|nr:hypothetical protein P8452_49283 [Trifolium repens]